MRLKYKNITIVFIAVASIIVLMRLCYLEEENVKATTLLDQYYKMDSDTVLHAISQDEKGIFTPVKSLSELSLMTGTVVEWSQTDYWQVAKAFHEFVWGESLDALDLNSIDFSLNCKNVYSGFRNARIVVVKTIISDQGKSRIERSMFFEPTSNYAYVTEVEYNPSIGGWKTIDLGKAKITADDALKIAEENGGQDERESVGNLCDISISLHPDSMRSRGWWVLYTPLSETEAQILFDLWIDPFTGKIEK